MSGQGPNVPGFCKPVVDHSPLGATHRYLNLIKLQTKLRHNKSSHDR